ncbi:DUF1217 domain-containing protein [Beijerinckia sp. L45]|uniref:DUF1217 domain-containing protein n=1 Tax=Beijerinckia sp. L45 TaxID=1641855 RepID=UPI00131CCE71|nr:DUF1217 domain-containing protein [Beijerinckia sp. L45]
MISTFLGYQLYGNNLQQSLARTAAEPAVSQAEAYYNANIGKVKTVSDLVNNYQLLSYATQAFGLSNMTYAKALLTQVLTSDPNSKTSVAAQLNDSRYTAFAAAFSFNTDGTLSTTAQLQTTAQQATTESLFNANTTLSSTVAAAATTNYENAMKSITTLSQLDANPVALGYVLTAYGADASTTSSTFDNTLESSLSSPTSYLNQQADAGYGALNKAFDVDSTGAATTTTPAETDANITATTNAYMVAAGSTAAAQTAAATETTYFTSKIGSITTAAELTSDPRLLAYVVKAYGLPSTATASDIQQALSSDPSSGTSFAATSPYPGFKALASAFNFDTTGAAKTVTQFQSAAQQQSTVQLYSEREGSDTAAGAAATAYYNANIGKATSVSDLENDPKLLSYVLTAYGIDPTTSDSTVSSVIENTSSIATSTANASLLQLKLGFNVDANGNATNPLTAQSAANITATTSAYLAAAPTDAASQTAALTATAYYKSAMANVTSVSSLLADPKLVAYIKQAYAIPATTTNTVLQQVLTSDVTSASSVANTMGSNFSTLAAAFDFSTTGMIVPETQGAQSKAQLNAVNNAYIEQQMETDASAQNPGIGLALYFQTNASKITDAYSILADSKLTTIFQTMMGLPSTASGADIDVQANAITNQFDFSDFKDPTKLKSLIQRFSILYDLNPPASTTTYSTTSLFGSTNTLDVTSLFGATSTGSTTSDVTTLFG